jgi:hypothetical protein
MAGVSELPLVGRLPLVLPDLGDTNVVPVDYVVDAMDALIHADCLDGQAFHLGHPRPQPLLEVYNALARVAGAPQVALGLTRRLLPPALGGLQLLAKLPGVGTAADLAAARQAGPPSAYWLRCALRPGGGDEPGRGVDEDIVGGFVGLEEGVQAIGAPRRADSSSLTVVECKLASNPEKRRTVIGQVIDYAAAI